MSLGLPYYGRFQPSSRPTVLCENPVSRPQQTEGQLKEEPGLISEDSEEESPPWDSVESLRQHFKANRLAVGVCVFLLLNNVFLELYASGSLDRWFHTEAGDWTFNLRRLGWALSLGSASAFYLYKAWLSRSNAEEALTWLLTALFWGGSLLVAMWFLPPLYTLSTWALVSFAGLLATWRIHRLSKSVISLTE